MAFALCQSTMEPNSGPAMLRIPPPEDQPFALVESEDGETVKFYLLEFPEPYRTLSFFSRYSLLHNQQVLEPSSMLRKEQPKERFQVLFQNQLKDRKEALGMNKKQPTKIPTLEEMAARAIALIEQREAAEASSKANGETPLHAAADQETFMPIERFEDDMVGGPPTAKKRSAPKRSGAPKAAKTPRRGTAKAAATGSGVPPVRQYPPVPPMAASAEEADETMGDSEADDELAMAIVAKIGGDAKAVRNLDVERILNGAKLGRTLQGVACQQSDIQYIYAFLDRLMLPAASIEMHPSNFRSLLQ